MKRSPRPGVIHPGLWGVFHLMGGKPFFMNPSQMTCGKLEDPCHLLECYVQYIFKERGVIMGPVETDCSKKETTNTGNSVLNIVVK